MESKIHICGNTLEDGWNFCAWCGQKIENITKAWECPRCNTLFEDDGKEHHFGGCSSTCLGNAGG